jgi:hypothetical protein
VTVQSIKLSAVSGEAYNQWTRQLQQQIVERYRHSVRNDSNDNPVFGIDDIPRRTDQGGFGIWV